jgi:hypothetical protein
MPIGDRIDQPLTPRGAPSGPLHARGCTTFIQENKAVDGYPFRTATPAAACLLDIRSVLLGGMERLFL